MPADPTGAAARWRDALAGWAIPEEILDAAPTSPWGFSVPVFARATDAALRVESPITRRARQALPRGGSVLDVGCGVGAASLPLADRAGQLIGVDESTEMLDAFRERVRAAGVDVETVRGRWPDVADRVGAAEVTVCRNVAYNVADLAGFARRLTEHTRHRVVVELTEEHPLAWMTPYWRDLHGIERPDGPTAEDAIAVLTEAGTGELSVDRWARDADWVRCATPPESDEELARRLCLTPDRMADLRSARARHGVPRTRQVVTVSWPGCPSAP